MIKIKNIFILFDVYFFIFCLNDFLKVGHQLFKKSSRENGHFLLLILSLYIYNMYLDVFLFVSLSLVSGNEIDFVDQMQIYSALIRHVHQLVFCLFK